MGAVGNFLSPDSKRILIKNQIGYGSVVKIYSNATIPPKEKYILLLHIDTFPLYVFINSEINSFKMSKPHLLEAQVELHQSSNSFFTKQTSYADCSNVHSNEKMEDIIIQLVANYPDWGPNQLDPDALFDILNAIEKSPAISQIHKDLISKNNE